MRHATAKVIPSAVGAASGTSQARPRAPCGGRSGHIRGCGRREEPSEKTISFQPLKTAWVLPTPPPPRVDAQSQRVVTHETKLKLISMNAVLEGKS